MRASIPALPGWAQCHPTALELILNSGNAHVCGANALASHAWMMLLRRWPLASAMTVLLLLPLVVSASAVSGRLQVGLQIVPSEQAVYAQLLAQREAAAAMASECQAQPQRHLADEWVLDPLLRTKLPVSLHCAGFSEQSHQIVGITF